MKLFKLGLASVVAAGALASVAGATPLEQAIKNVEVSGFARYRFDNVKSKTAGDKVAEKPANHRFTANVNFKAMLDDNFFGVIGLKYDNRDGGNHAAANGGIANTKQAGGVDGYSENGEFNVRQFYLGYMAGNTTIQFGRQELGTFFTDDMVGTGAKLLNQDVEGLTLAAVAFDALENDGDIGTSELNQINGAYTYQHNLYGVAAIGSYDPISFQLWFATLQDVASLSALDVAAEFGDDDAKFGLHAQVAGSSFKGKFKTATNDDAKNGHFLGVEATASISGFDASAGFVDFSTKKANKSLISFEDNGEFIAPGEDIMGYSFFSGENKFAFVTAGLTFADDFMIGADLVAGNNKTTSGKTKKTETVARFGYDYSKKLGFESFYSFMTEKPDGSDKTTSKHFRLQAKYSF